MEPRFSSDFSGVRVHSGRLADQSARDLNAHAYTVGNDIVFGAGRWSPGTDDGRRLIAHELTHVVQQRGKEGPAGSGFAVIARQPTSSNPPVAQATSGDRVAIERALSTRNADELLAVTDLSPVSLAERILLIELCLENPGPLVNFLTFSPLIRLWESLGPDRLGAFAHDNWDLWLKSLDVAPALAETSSVTALKERFRDDVRQEILHRLNESDRMVSREIDRIERLATMSYSERETEVTTLVSAAIAYKRALDAEQKLRAVRVRGFWIFKVPNVARTGEDWMTVDATFDPARPPTDQGYPDDPAHDPYQGLPTWEEIKWLYDQLAGAMADLGEAQPALYVASRSGLLGDLAYSSESIEAYNTIAGPVLNALQATADNIAATRERVQSGDRDPLDFGPIVDAVRFGSVMSDSRTDWPGLFYRWVTAITVSDYTTISTTTMKLDALGLLLSFIPPARVLAILAFLASAGVTSVNAWEAWDLADALESAEHAAVRPGEELVEPGAAAAAHTAAIVSTVVAIANVVLVFTALHEPAPRGGAAAGEEAAPGLPPEEAPKASVPEPAPTAPIPEPTPTAPAPAAPASVTSRPPAAAGSQNVPPSPPKTFTVDEVRTIFRRAIKREPTLNLKNLEREVDPLTFNEAFKNAGGRGVPPPAFVDPNTNRIWIRIGDEDTLTLFHESVHHYSIANRAREPFVNEFGSFLEEGVTERVTRDTLGPNWTWHSYDAAVEMIDEMERRLGVPESAVVSAYLDGNRAALRTAIQAGFGGDGALTGTFLAALRNVGIGNAANNEALLDAIYVMIMKQPRP
jgi:hypothetical protein